MESLRIDILNPKAKVLLENLEELKLIRIKKEPTAKSFKALLKELRSQSDEVITADEIASLVEEARRTRYEK